VHVTPRESRLDIGAAAQLACLLEATAPKPGNVSPGLSFGDTTYDDFLASAAAIGHPLGTAATRPLGETILLALEATRRWTSANTNLGIILLLAPLARAAGLDHGGAASIAPDTLRTELRRVLAETTVDDARSAYAGIRRSAPGGLGTVAAQDVASDPSVTLTEAMRLAADRDGIASEYATNFRATFEVAAPALCAARNDGLSWNDAIVETFLTVLAAQPDTHIARRAGVALARDVTSRAVEVMRLGGVRTPQGRLAIARFDATLRDERNRANPGTTADITAASIFVVLLAGGWHSRNGGVDAAPR
jgi:triphosphoribosyl-dephospho-CoA synthase